MLLDYAVSAFLTLFVVDPIGLTPTFLAVTEGCHALPSTA